ncbi:hypothetical protein JCM3765_002732 [Sporobolomyces pararoseus]
MKRSESPQVALYPASEDPDEDDPLDFLPPLPYHLPPRTSPSHSSKQKQLSSSSSSSKKKNKKSAQSIQTPSASPRHLPNREPQTTTTTASSKSGPPTKRRRTSSLVFRNDIDTEEMTPRKERILRRKQKLDQSEMVDQSELEVTSSSGKESKTDKGRTRREEERRSDREREMEEIEREMRKGSEEFVVAAQEEEEEEDHVKDEEPSEDEDLVFMKDEDEREVDDSTGEHRTAIEEQPHDTIADWPSRNDTVIRKRHPQPHEPNHSRPQRDQSIEDHSPNRQIHRPQAQHSPSPSASSPPHSRHSIPTLSAFIHSLDLPRLSRLIETFHDLGISTSEDVLALASTTTAGQRRREEIWKLVGEVERERGREFTKFEMATLKVGLEESRVTWGV